MRGKIAIVDCLGVYPMVRLSLPSRRILAYLALRGRPQRAGWRQPNSGRMCRTMSGEPTSAERYRTSGAGIADPPRPRVAFVHVEAKLLMVIGHADTRGYGRYDNEALSKRRADNTIKAIQNVLGDKFRIEAHIQTIAAGDKLAAQQSGNKVLPTFKHRRCKSF